MVFCELVLDQRGLKAYKSTAPRRVGVGRLRFIVDFKRPPYDSRRARIPSAPGAQRRSSIPSIQSPGSLSLIACALPRAWISVDSAIRRDTDQGDVLWLAR